MCGIFGIITPKPRKFDLRAFCVLGVNNDSRGGDSCGVLIDNKYEYGVNELKLFYNFFPKSKVLNSVTKCQVALGHCRKASVGAINAANAQPIVIKDNNGKVQFALIHNGTILNYLDLAKQYIPDVDTEGMTDSQVMAHIFYHTGYKVLGEYLGAGAFVMVDYRKGEPEVFFFKGESKVFKYSTVKQIERPLFYTYSSTEFVFSSIMDYLKALRPGREVFSIPPNKLLTLKEGRLYIVGKYDRSNLWQSKSYFSYTDTNYDYSSITNRACNTVKRGSEDFFPQDDFDTNYYWNEVVDMDKNGVYMIGTEKAHGLFWVDAMGDIEKKKVANTIQVAFWKGVLLKNAACYSFLSKFAKDRGVSPNWLMFFMPDLVHFLSPCACWKTRTGQWVTSDTPTTNFPYTGTAIFPFTAEEVSFTGGKFDTYIEEISYEEALYDLQMSIDYKVDEDAIRESLNSRS